MRILKVLLLFISITGFAQEAHLPEVEITEFKEKVAHRAENLETLSSDFVQTKYMELMEEAVSSSGKLYYKSPNILKWEYATPYSFKLLFKEGKLYINDDGDKSVTNLNSNKLFEKLITLISGSINGKLLEDKQNFEITYSKIGNLVTARIVPKDENLRQMFNQIILVFNQEYLVNSVKLMEESGDYTKIVFKNSRLNLKLVDSLFEN
ncbi:outer membrane lipoprotein carrier protein LolA [Gillisia sp. M10.2A]|uniref:Outer membrane lipoprotein carrier protein LolA n=1 Tax=Gillisia lutea TaxID=2909668 RepID=A0ABS9EHJ6_9FLAO|nr:outer membrane lipoprotein carrier protein LolA [Gillisia lutea]MCF4101634.1 outer membrane lipoprotein carrier protein LolA [Gillisia lutea]